MTMRYTKGSLGRVFVVRFDDGELFLDGLSALVRKERVKAATVVLVGALKKGRVVAGPRRPVIPPQPFWVGYSGAWEVAGLGTVFTGKGGPRIHIHAAMGKKRRALTGCIRKESEVYLVLEAVIFELKGIKASKEIDPTTGLSLLHIA